uniref:Uncharacterized protein n=1 Tax=Anguilla anguilla TaxID=7936 RepID=A0A0E9R0V4_ANGAN
MVCTNSGHFHLGYSEPGHLPAPNGSGIASTCWICCCLSG